MSKAPQLTEAQRAALLLDRNLSVVAGAGTGKTHVLTERFLKILEKTRTDRQRLDVVRAHPHALVAVTFTRKAANEMRTRLTEKIGDRIKSARDDGDTAALRHWTATRRALDRATITTIDGLASKLVRDLALEVGLDPDFRIVEGVDQTRLIDDAIDRTLRTPPPECADALVAWYTFRGPRQIRNLMRELVKNRQTAEAWIQTVTTRTPEALFADIVDALATMDEATTAALVERWSELTQHVVEVQSDVPQTQRFVAACRAIAAAREQTYQQRLVAVDRFVCCCTGDPKRTGEPRRLYVRCNGMLGKKDAWNGILDKEQQLSLFDAINDSLEPILPDHAPPPNDEDRRLLDHGRGLAMVLAEVLACYDADKKQNGLLDYHDLVHRALDILDRPGIKELVRQRYRHMLVDEFQDTNAVQWRLVQALGADPLTEAPMPGADPLDDIGFQSAADLFEEDEPDDEDAAEAEADPPAAGTLDSFGIDTLGSMEGVVEASAPTVHLASDDRLGADRVFIVGDAKQSIYAFRGADVAVYLASQRAVVEANHRHRRDGPARDEEGQTLSENWRAGEVDLDTNFRSLPGVVGVTNALFDLVLSPDGETHTDHEARPGPVHAFRDPLPSTEGTVHMVVAPQDLKAAHDHGMLSKEEAARTSRDELGAFSLVQDILRRIQGSDEERLTVTVRKGDPEYVDDEQQRPAERHARFGDVAILLRARTSLPVLERVLRLHDIPYVVGAGRGFWQRQEVWDLVNAMAFAADPYHRDLELAGILRSPLFGWSDASVVALAATEGHSLWKKLQRLAEGGTEWAAASSHAGAPVEDTCAILRSLTKRVDTLPASRLLAYLLEQTAYLGAFADDREHAQIGRNVEKLVRVVRDMEARKGLRLYPLVRELEHLIDGEVDESEAELERHGDAVRILTVHASKGLEFPVVYVAQLEREFSSNTFSDVAGVDLGQIVPRRADQRPLTLLTTKLPDRNGDMQEPATHVAIRIGQKRRDRAEMKRLLYVAATRAQDHLVLHATSRRLLAEPGKGDVKPAADALRAGNSWLDWLEGILRLDAPTYDGIIAQDAPARPVPIGDTHIHVLPHVPRIDDHPRAVLSLEETSSGPIRVEPVVDVAVPHLRISPSDLEVHAQCPARFRHRVIDGLPEPRLPGPRGRRADYGAELGRLVHRALMEETNDDGVPLPVQRSARQTAQGNGWDPERLVNDVERHVAQARKQLRGRAVTEVPFDALLGTHLRVAGRIDRMEDDGAGWRIVDHKTDDRSRKDGAEIAQEKGYDRQVALYTKAMVAAMDPGGAAAPGTVLRPRLVFSSDGSITEIDTDAALGDLITRIDDAVGHPEDAEQKFPRAPRRRADCGACPYLHLHGGPCAGATEADPAP